MRWIQRLLFGLLGGESDHERRRAMHDVFREEMDLHPVEREDFVAFRREPAPRPQPTPRYAYMRAVRP